MDRNAAFYRRVIFLSVLFSSLSFAQPGKNFLWQVQSTSTTVYLLGSMHLATEDLYPLHRNVEEAFEKSQYLVLEVELNPVAAYKMGKIIRDQGVYPNTETLYDHIDPSTKKLFANYLKKRGLPDTGLIKFKPGILSMTLSAIELQHLGLKEEYGIDMYFLKKARMNKKQVLELESVEEQMHLILNIPNESDFFRYTLISMETMSEQFNAMVYAWKQGNTSRLHKLIYGDTVTKFPKLKKIMTALIDERNKKMLSKIKTYLASDKIYFVVVGAGHLTGELGLVNLLKNADYTIKQL